MRVKMGILSDTHGLLRPEVMEHLQGCSLILHGGDIGGQEILDRLAKLAPVRAVRGNNDKEWAEKLPFAETITFSGIQVYMCHKKKDIPAQLQGTELVVYGHSHKFSDKVEQGIRYLNPGSCGPRRFNQEISMAILEIPEEGNGSFQIRQIVIPHREGNVAIPESEPDREKVVKAVIRGIQRGTETKMIAEKNHISVEFAEEISRMYLTHPGIDVDGILNRLRPSSH